MVYNSQSVPSYPTTGSVRRWLALSSLCFLGTFTGCTALTRPIDGVPAKRLPREFFQSDRSSLVAIDISLLAQEEPRNYTLGPGDVLGVVVDRILPPSKPDEVPPLPPVHFPDLASTLPPSTGFPLTILDDGTISLPLLKPIEVEGLTLDQARDKIRQTYVDAEILQEEQELSPVVTLIRKRQVNVTVVRQDNTGLLSGLQGGRGGGNWGLANFLQRPTGTLGVEYAAAGTIVKLDAFQNDVLHALMNTGGLPGVSSKNEVQIIRSNRRDKMARLEFMRQYSQMLAQYQNDPCNCPPPMPDDPTIIRIPLRLPPGEVPNFTEQDIILEDGDVVLIETRDTEFFFTGGLLPGGQFPLPRDYDLDALGAMAMAGYGLERSAQGNPFGVSGFSQVVPPGRLYILRPSVCGNDQIAIEVDLAKAVNDPRQRPIIKAGDTLILQYRPCEEAINFGVGTFFTYGIWQLIRR
ncbi:MAG: polysaccharide biosynthesis/export family protein [Pirellulaceae bacterium]|nr:polysaccharide biosynthesis/export family protein [Pirellulaceae bacterium]